MTHHAKSNPIQSHKSTNGFVLFEELIEQVLTHHAHLTFLGQVVGVQPASPHERQQLQIVKVWLHPHDRIIALFTLITNGRPPHHPAARPSRSIDDLLGDPLLVFIAHLNPSIGLAAPKRQRCGARAHPNGVAGFIPKILLYSILQTKPQALHHHEDENAEPHRQPGQRRPQRVGRDRMGNLDPGLAVEHQSGVLAPRAVGSTTSPLRPSSMMTPSCNRIVRSH